MKFTLNWLKNHLDTPASLDEILTTLTAIGLEVETCQNRAEDLKNFIVAEIHSTMPHPDAERLQICQVFDGTTMKQIICGAANARAGLKVVLAQPGCRIPSTQLIIKVGKIRGVESQGMLCSEDELGLSTAPSCGIMELASHLVAGTPIGAALHLNDPLIEIAVTPNRPDCLGVRGIARDLAAAGLGTLKPLDLPKVQGTFSAPHRIELQHPSCSYYLGRLIKNVKNGESPAEIQRLLRAIGLAPISALVDFTNFMTHDIGRPAHVYDADKIGLILLGRAATAEETLEALNNKTYTLSPQDGVIADETRCLGLAGIIGSEASGCSPQTQNVFLELAYCDPVEVSWMGRRHSLNTDSRYRMERGIDKHGCDEGMDYLTDCILSCCGGEPSQVITAGTRPLLSPPILFDTRLIEKRVGLTVPLITCTKILESLGMQVVELDHTTLKVTAPSWRPDIGLPEDLVEEVLRIYGYDKIPALPLPAQQPGPVVSLKQKTLFQIASYLTTVGYDEVINWSMLSEKAAHLFSQTSAELKINNPITEDLAWMRPSLLPGMLKTLEQNLNKGGSSLHIFETGHVYHGLEESAQPLHIAGLRYGSMVEKSWQLNEELATVFTMKADALACLDIAHLSVDKVQLKTASLPTWYHPGRASALMLGPKICLGFFGEIHPTIQAAYNIPKPVFAFELHLDACPIKAEKTPNKGPLVQSKFQPITRDFSFLIDDSIPVELLIQAIQKSDQKIVSRVTVFDIYQGKTVPEGKFSASLRLHLQPQDHTLSDQEIKVIYDKAIELATTIPGVEFRL